MKALLLSTITALLLCPQSIFAWGNGHDDVNRIALKILPPEIIAQLPGDMRNKVVQLSHVPDDFTPWEKWNKYNVKISPADLKVLKQYKMKYPYSLHSANGQAVNLILLTNAFKAKSPDRIALWMACLLHTFADEGAANHDPLIGCMIYTFGGEYKMKIRKGVGTDFSIIARNKADKKIIDDLLKNIKIKPLATKPEEALLKVMMSGLESNAYLTRRGSAIAASYAQNPSKKTITNAKKALAELGLHGTVKACEAIVTAWGLAKANAKLELTKDIKKEYAKRKALFIKNRPLSDDSLFAELLEKQTTQKSAVGILVEPSISMNHCKLTFSSKLLASSIARTLSATKIPFRFVDIRDLESKRLLSPGKMPVLVVCAGKFRVFRPGQKRLKTYVNSGGKLVWIGGEHKNMLGKLSSHLVKTKNEKLPVNLKYGKRSPIGDKVRFKFNQKFSKKLSQKEYRFVHCPNTRAGWQVPICPFLMKKTDDKDIMVLTKMRVDKELTPVAGALLDSKGTAKIIFIPEYLIAPFLLSDEDTVVNPARLQLDKVGREIFNLFNKAIKGKIMNIKGLLIDIDDTLIRFNPDKVTNTTSLMQVLKRAGHELGGLSVDESKDRVEWVNANIRWWCWADYIKKLELDETAFWEYAYDIERKYLEPSEPDLVKSFELLKSAGFELYITSNNPNKGIQHKLRLADIPTDKQTELFTKLLGATEMRDMKWETNYWLKAIAQTGIKPENLAVIGDNFRDDYQIPQAAGIAMTYLIDINNQYADQVSPTLKPVSGIAQIARELQPIALDYAK